MTGAGQPSANEPYASQPYAGQPYAYESPGGFDTFAPPGAPGAEAGTTRRSRASSAVGGSEAGGPGRRLVVGSIAGALLGGCLVGLVAGVVSPPAPPELKVISAPATSARASSTQSGAAAPARSASTSPSASLRTTQQT